MSSVGHTKSKPLSRLEALQLVARQKRELLNKTEATAQLYTQSSRTGAASTTAAVLLSSNPPSRRDNDVPPPHPLSTPIPSRPPSSATILKCVARYKTLQESCRPSFQHLSFQHVNDQNNNQQRAAEQSGGVVPFNCSGVCGIVNCNAYERANKRQRQSTEHPFVASILPTSNGMGGDGNGDDVVVEYGLGADDYYWKRSRRVHSARDLKKRRRIGDFVRRQNGEAAFLAAMDRERLENVSLPEDATVNSDWSVLKHAPHLDVILDVARDPNFEAVSADYSLTVHREAGATVLHARTLALAMGINVDVNGDGREVEALWLASGHTDCPFSPEMLSGMKAFAAELKKEDLSGVDTDVGQWNYTAWFVLRFLTKEQIDWLKIYELGLWIALHSTKIGESDSLKNLLTKMQHLQSYIPFAIVKFKARLCENGEDREQCKHCVWWTRNVNGERFFLSKDERDSVLAPLPDESPGIIIYGHTLPPRLLNRKAEDKAKGELYYAKIDLPASTLTNLSKLNGGFYGVIHGPKLGSVFKGTPSERFGSHTWTTSFGIKYFTVLCDTPFMSEKELQWSIKDDTPDLHNQGEWFKANEDLEKKVSQFFANHGSICHGRYDRARLIKSIPKASLDEWTSSRWISQSMKDTRMADDTLSFSAKYGVDTCSHEGCSTKVYGRGLCRKHWEKVVKR